MVTPLFPGKETKDERKPMVNIDFKARIEYSIFCKVIITKIRFRAALNLIWFCS